MFPTATFNNRADCRNSYPIFACQDGISNPSGRSFTYFAHLGGVQLAKMGFFARRTSALCEHVMRVISGCAKKKMGRIDTSPTIPVRTVMANIKTIWNWAVMQLPASAMRWHLGSIVIFSDCSIIISLATVPQPTFVRAAFVYLLPKAIFEWTTPTVSLDKPSRLPLDIPHRGIAFGGDSSCLSTPTHAQARWVWRLRRGELLTQVILNVLNGLTFNPSLSRIVSLRNRSLVSTSAFAITVGNILRGMIGVHGKLPFLCLIRERFVVAARYFRVHFSFNYSMNGAN